MPWADKVASVVQAWYLGNATGDAIADVITGAVNPAGKLPLTFPKKLADVPSYGHFNSENGVVRYSEDIFVGYKHYQYRDVQPMWAFGYGLSYTTFEFSDFKIDKPSVKDNDLSLTVSVTVTNTGSVPGQEVVQAYVAITPQADPAPIHVLRALKAFKKTAILAPGEKTTVELSLDKYAVSWWDERISAWVVEKGKYGLEIGNSSVVLPLQGSFEIEKGFEWTGL
jgi:beta-glucosidase